MKFLSLCFLFLSPVLLAQNNTLLYKIHKKGYEDSYIFGTTHLIPDTAFYFPEKLNKILGSCDAVVLEIDDITNQDKAKELMRLKSGSAFDIFSPVQKDSVIQWGSATLHMTPEAFEKGFSTRVPFMLLQIGMQSMLKVPVKSYELEIMGRAYNNEQPIYGLETMEFQVSVFQSLPDSVMASMILEEIRHPEANAEQERKLTGLYIAKNTEALAAYVSEEQGSAELTQSLIVDRNRNWIPKITDYMQTRSCFFAVGAGHLGGASGVLQLLKNEGFDVTPVNY